MDEAASEKRPARGRKTKTGKAICALHETDLLLRVGVKRQLKAGCSKCRSFRGNPAKPSSNLKFSHRFVTTADAKIPLSVVQVKCEPQYVVFVHVTLHHLRQHPISAVQNRNRRIQGRFPRPKSRASRAKPGGEAGSISQPSLPRPPPQGAEVVQFKEVLCKLWTTRALSRENYPGPPEEAKHPMPYWHGDLAWRSKRHLSDWVTQRWVCATGRRVSLATDRWLDGPIGGTRKIGKHFFDAYAAERNLETVRDGVRGLIPDFQRLEAGDSSLKTIAVEVKQFYEQTSEFDLDAWSEWHGLFRPFGRALSLLFSSRLQQLNVPLSSLDSAKGMTSNVDQMRDPVSGEIVQTAWIRELIATENVLYAGSYSLCAIPGQHGSCVKVVFRCPTGVPSY